MANIDIANDDAGEDGQRHLSNKAVIAYLVRQWRRRPRLFAGMTLTTLASVACDLLIPTAAGALVGALGGADAEGAGPVWLALGAFVALSAGATAFRFGLFQCEIHFSSRNMQDLTADSFAQVQRLSADWHANTFAGSTVRKLTRGMWAYDTATATLFYGLIPTTVVLVGMPILMMNASLIVGVYALSVMAVFMVVSMIAAVRFVKPANLISNARDSDVGAAIADAVGANAVVKSFGAEAREDARMVMVLARWRRAALRTWGRYVTMATMQSLTALLLSTGAIGLAVWSWSNGRAGAGEVTTVIASFLIMAGYLRRFGEEVQNVQRAFDELEDLEIFARAAPDVADAPGAAPFKPGPGRIVFTAVGFGYAGQDRRLYDGFHLEIAPGERVALVGPTGSGKSTFVRLLQRLYDVHAGAITIDGQDVRAVTQTSLRAAIALVPQDPALFHRSIADNIAYGRPGARQADIEDAARRARAHDFITRLPQGYGTLVGERGVKLSGGERQRVAIARALLANAPILVMDEATSSLDNETERLVQDAMAEITAGRTSIIIAHRLSTVRDADRILVFENGRIVEQGRHADLISVPGGAYARLHQLAEMAG